MAINVSQAFHRTSANPVDESMALTKAQMLTVNDNLMPAYYFTICQDDGEIYLYDKTATASVETGKFKKFEGGGGGGTEGVVITKTLLASGWDANNRQALTFTEYDADMGGVIGMPTNATAAQKEAYAESIINVYSQSGNQFTFECEEKPSIDLPVTLYAGGGSGGSTDLPSGGTTGQALIKHSNADQDVEWGDVASDIQVATLPARSAENDGKIYQYIGNTTSDYKFGCFYYGGTTMNGGTVVRAWRETVTQDLQKTTMPTANLTEVGMIYQYIGTTTNDFIQGEFYKCISDGYGYIWQQISGVTAPSEKIQYDTMPTASADNLGQIVQYIGTTTANYTNGLFYECVSDGQPTPTYSWAIKDVQTYPEVDLTNVFASGMPISTADKRPFAYSTEEQIVGSWIDGKPIYQKTIDFGHSLTDAGDIQQEWLEPVGASIDRVINVWGNMHHTNNNWGSSLIWCDVSSYATLGAYNNNETDTTKKNKVGIYWKGDCDWITDPIITIQYTKITD